MLIRSIRADEAQVLRAAILRPGVPLEASVYPLDFVEESLHLGAFEDEKLITVASFFHEPPPGEDDSGAWRLRGMVTLPEAERRGYGRSVLLKGISYVARQRGTLLWCNARLGAVDFYRKLRFETEGSEQKTERGTGFIRMMRAVTPDDMQTEQG